MAKDTSKSPASKPARGAARSRRELLRRQPHQLSHVIELIVGSPALGWGILTWAAFIVLCSWITGWSRQQPLVSVNRIANETIVSRVEFQVPDLEQTRQNKMLARQRTPWVYTPSLSNLEAIHSSIENLPRTLATVEKPAEVIPEVAQQFPGLTDQSLVIIKSEAVDGAVSPGWKRRADQLNELLKDHPVLEDKDYQRLNAEGPAKIDLQFEGGSQRRDAASAVSVRDEKLPDIMRDLARRAGYTEPVLSVIAARLAVNPGPTFQHDAGATETRQRTQADAQPDVKKTINEGDVLLLRGQAVTQEQLDRYREEIRQFSADPDQAWRQWVRTFSVVGAVTAIAVAMAGYLIIFAPGVRQSPKRMLQVAGLLAAALCVACFPTVLYPNALAFTAIAPAVFTTVILVIAYDRRVALALGSLLGVLICMALSQPIGVYALILTGISFAVVQVNEIRDRRGVIRMGLYSAAALAVGTVLVALIDRPITLDSLRQTLIDAALAGGGGIIVGIITLALLNSIERTFDVTTGLTLIELRDPKQPLLRQLQQRAPGTYNHSLNVASIAEAAADAIKADSLRTYVGALYHDIGKMNKPEYFVENQAGGPNRHDKLSPAMSLLVIVGHVKDGMALAEEYNLPQSLRHFIEAHHGTTLVEFFYNRARRQAEQSAAKGAAGEPEPDLPEEIEYRYPGPKPRTKEAAILMLADAVESATRSMVEPTPSRIDALVRALANKRLMDGQFDDCDLTLRELQTIVESISKTVASIYHGRIAYPSTIEERPAEKERA